MARPNGGFTELSPIPVNPRLIASSITVEDVSQVLDYDPETKDRSPKTREDGAFQWELACLFRPIEGDRRHTVGIVPVKIWAKTKPVVKIGAQPQFVNFRVIPWSNDNGCGLSYADDDVKTVAQ
ncbi:hypothetical protein PG1513B_0801 [Bifidobacterium pseudolongum subsp. pseudolongum]|nr:hypothetical protein PG1513B_0801 [Bifidobacterium pseudolongum subsp. pseudolongum]